MRNIRQVELVMLVAGLSLTTSILAQQMPKRQGATSPKAVAIHGNGAVSSADKISFEPAPVAPEAAEEALRHTMSSGGMGRMELRAAPGSVAISTSATIYETRADVRYLWALRVYDRKKTTKFVERFYDHQIFSPELGQEVTPTFEEVMRLQPGDYIIDVSIYQFPVGFAVATLKDGQVESSHNYLHGGEYVTVPR